MADYGFEVKNDDGDYLVSDKTTSLTFVKRAININSFSTGVPSPTQGTKVGFGGFSELVYRVTNCNATPVPFFTIPRNDKVYSVNRIRNAGGNSWDIHVITNAKPYHKGTFSFTGGSYIPSETGLSGFGLYEAITSNQGLDPVVPSYVATTEVGSVYIVPQKFASSYVTSGLDRGGYIVLEDKSCATINSAGAATAVVPFIMQAFGSKQRFSFRNLCRSGNQIGWSIPLSSQSNSGNVNYSANMIEETPTGIFSSLQYDGGDLSHRNTSYEGSDTTGIPSNSSYWKARGRLGAVRYNYRGNDVLKKQGHYSASTTSSLTNSVEYRAGQITAVNNFSGADTNRGTGEFTVTNATSSRGSATPGVFGIDVNASGVVTQVKFDNLSIGNIAGDVITVPGSALGGGTNFTFSVQTISNNTRVYVTQYGYENIAVGQYLNFGGTDYNWYEIVSKGFNVDIPKTLAQGTVTYDDYFIEVAGNKTSLAITDNYLRAEGTIGSGSDASLADSVGTSTGNRKYNEEAWMPGGEAFIHTGLYVRGWLSNMGKSWGSSYGATYTSTHEITNRDFLALSPYAAYTDMFFDYSSDTLIAESFEGDTTLAETSARAFKTYHDAVYGVPNTSKSVTQLFGNPTLNVDSDAPTSFDHARQTDTYKSAPYWNNQIYAGRGSYQLYNMVRNTQHTFYLPRVMYRLQPSPISIASTTLFHGIVNKGDSAYHRIHTSSTAGGIMHNESNMLWAGKTFSNFYSTFNNPRTFINGETIDFTKENYGCILNDTQLDEFRIDSLLGDYLEQSIKVHPISLCGAGTVQNDYGAPIMYTGLPPSSENINISIDIPDWTLTSNSAGTIYTGSGPVLQVADLAASHCDATNTKFLSGSQLSEHAFMFMKYDGVGTAAGTYKVSQINTTTYNQYLEITAGSVSSVSATTQATWATGIGSATDSANHFIKNYSTDSSDFNFIDYYTDPGITDTNAGCHLPDYSNLVLDSTRPNQFAQIIIRITGKTYAGETFTKYVAQRIHPPRTWTADNGTTQYEDVKLFINKGQYAYAADYMAHFLSPRYTNRGSSEYHQGREYYPPNKLLRLDKTLNTGVKSNTRYLSGTYPPQVAIQNNNIYGGLKVKDYLHCYKMADYNLTKRRFTNKLNLPLFDHSAHANYFHHNPQYTYSYTKLLPSSVSQVETEHGFGRGNGNSSPANITAFNALNTNSKTLEFFSGTTYRFFFDSNYDAGRDASMTSGIPNHDGNAFGMTGHMSFGPVLTIDNFSLSLNEFRPLATLCAMDYFGAETSTAKCSFVFYEQLQGETSWTVIQSTSTNPYCDIFIRNPFPIDGTSQEGQNYVEGSAIRRFKVVVNRLAGYPNAKTAAAEAYCTMTMQGYGMVPVYLRKFHINTYEDASNKDAWIHSGFGKAPDTTQVVFRTYIPGVKAAYGSIDNIHGFNAQPFYVTRAPVTADSNWSSGSFEPPPALSDRSWRTTYNGVFSTSDANTDGHRPTGTSFGYYPISQTNTGAGDIESPFVNPGNSSSPLRLYHTYSNVSSSPYTYTTRTASPAYVFKISVVENDSTTSQHIADALSGGERGYIKTTSGFLDAGGTYTEAIYWDGDVVATNASNPQNPLPASTTLGDFTYEYDDDDDADFVQVTFFIIKKVRAFGPFLEDDEGVQIAASDNEFDATNIPQLYIFADPATAPTPHSTDKHGIQVFKADGSTLLFDSRQRVLQIHDIAQANFPARAFTRNVSLKGDSWGWYANHSSSFYPDQYTTVSNFSTPTNGAYAFNTKIQRTEFEKESQKKKKTWNEYYHETRYWANYKGGISRSASDVFKTGYITVLAGHRYDVGKNNRVGFTGIKIGGDTRKSGGVTNYQDATYNTGSETLISINTDLYKGNQYKIHIFKASASSLGLDGQDRDGDIDETDLITESGGTYTGPTLRYLVGDDILIGRHTGMASGGVPTGGFRLFDRSVSATAARASIHSTMIPNDTAFRAINPLSPSNNLTLWVPDQPGTYYLKTSADGYDRIAVPIVIEAA
jgi:hypothetical protein